MIRQFEREISKISCSKDDENAYIKQSLFSMIEDLQAEMNALKHTIKEHEANAITLKNIAAFNSEELQEIAESIKEFSKTDTGKFADVFYRALVKISKSL